MSCKCNSLFSCKRRKKGSLSLVFQHVQSLTLLILLIGFSQMSMWSSLTQRLFPFLHETIPESDCFSFVSSASQSAADPTCSLRDCRAICADLPVGNFTYNRKRVKTTQESGVGDSPLHHFITFAIIDFWKLKLSCSERKKAVMGEREKRFVFEGVPPLSLSPSYEGWGCWRFGDDWWSL